MARPRAFAGTTVVLGLGTLAHAILTWPLDAAVAFFGGGALVAFIAEAVAINLGWLEHHIGPKVGGVPLYALFGWTGIVYLAFRVALLMTTGWVAVAIAAILATAYDFIVDHRGVAAGHWSYTDELPGPRFRGIPWWNFAGWLVISALTVSFAVPFL